MRQSVSVTRSSMTKWIQENGDGDKLLIFSDIGNDGDGAWVLDRPKISSFRGWMGYSKKTALILCNYNTKRFLRKLKFGDFYMLFN